MDGITPRVANKIIENRRIQAALTFPSENDFIQLSQILQTYFQRITGGGGQQNFHVPSVTKR